MEETPYTKREVDLIIDKMTTYHNITGEKLKIIDAKVEYTNGKLKRVILAIAIISALLIGAGFKDILPLLMTII